MRLGHLACTLHPFHSGWPCPHAAWLPAPVRASSTEHHLWTGAPFNMHKAAQFRLALRYSGTSLVWWGVKVDCKAKVKSWSWEACIWLADMVSVVLLCSWGVKLCGLVSNRRCMKQGSVTPMMPSTRLSMLYLDPGLPMVVHHISSQPDAVTYAVTQQHQNACCLCATDRTPTGCLAEQNTSM